MHVQHTKLTCWVSAWTQFMTNTFRSTLAVMVIFTLIESNLPQTQHLCVSYDPSADTITRWREVTPSSGWWKLWKKELGLIYRNVIVWQIDWQCSCVAPALSWIINVKVEMTLLQNLLYNRKWDIFDLRPFWLANFSLADN